MTLKLCVMIRWGNGDCACIEEMNISISSDLNIYKVEKIECYSVMQKGHLQTVNLCVWHVRLVLRC